MEFVTRADEKPEHKGRSFCLIVMAGPDKGATYALSTGVYVLGRAPDSTIVLHGRGVSRKHAVVYVKPHGDVIIEDQGSTNGVYLDGERTTRATWEPGQTLGLGPEVTIRLELSSLGVQSLLQEMYQGSTQDSLTGLLTRRGFEERLDIEFALVQRHSMSSCLAVIDLDRFKAVNDREGHEAGDLVLQTLGRLLKQSARVGDLACRWGGEEFILYIRQTPLVGAMTMLERLRERFAESDISLPSGGLLRVTFSAGVVDLVEFESWRDGFRRADESLYQAKRDGRNRISFFSVHDV